MCLSMLTKTLSSPNGTEAVVEYLDANFRIVKSGSFVRCAVTSAPIVLEELKYWSVANQEAYASPEAVMTRLGLRRKSTSSVS
jgi:hypothetical protein